MTGNLRNLTQLPKKILISRTDRIGDFILTLPVFEAMHRFIKIDFTVLCQSSVVPLLKNNPYVTQVIGVSPNQPQTEIVQKIGQQGLDGLLVLVNDRYIRKLLPVLRHIPVRIGPLSKPQMIFRYTHPVIQKRFQSIKNEAEYNLDLLKIFKIDFNNKLRPTVYLGGDELKSIKNSYPFIGDTSINCVVMHPGMSGSALNWPKQHYQELLKKLIAKNIFVLLTGASESERVNNDRYIFNLDSAQQKQALNIAQKLTLRGLAALYAQCKLYIGPSTGPTHLAAAVRTPIISFYPPIQAQSATRWEPYLAKAAIFSPQIRCTQKFSCINEKCTHYFCMSQISVDQIVEQSMKFIDQSTSIK